MTTTRLARSRQTIWQQILDPTLRSLLVKAFAKGLTIEGLKLRAMRRRPGSRHVFSCELILLDHRSGEQRSIELIGKRDTTRAVGKAAREFEAMQLLWEAGFGLDERFRIPRPVQHFADLGLILQGKAVGSKLRSYVGRGNDGSLSYVRMAGLWLAKLHNLKVPSPQMCTYVNEIASLRMFVAALTADQPNLAAELQQRAAIVEHAFAGFQHVPATIVHGDFHPDHIFVGRDFITVIDFERFCVTDPARDLGSFIAHMRTMACLSGRSCHAANREADAFLESYFNAVPLIQRAEMVRRIGPYVALAAFEALYYVASVLKVGDPDRIAMYLKCLQQLELRGIEYAAPHVALRAAG
jgi:aminoglycoside phosphotransferase (APT) family kinase protein